MFFVPVFDYRANGQQKHEKVVIIGFLVLQFKRRQLIMQKFNCSWVKAASLLPKFTSMSKAANRDVLVNLNYLHFVNIFYLLHNSETSLLLSTTSSFV